MARSSRHKSHRSHKHRDRSDSEDEGDSRERRQRAEEEDSAMVSRVSDQEKRKSSSKDGIGTSNGDLSGEHNKKRKDRMEDRWNGRGDDDVRVDKVSKMEGSDAVDAEKGSKSKVSVLDLKGKSSSSRNEDKKSSEKEISRRESSSSQYKDGKEKERGRENERERERERERGSEKDKKVQDSRHERAEDGSSRKDCIMKQDVEISDLQDEMPNPELEKELEKRKRRRDESGDRDKWVDDDRGYDDRKISSKDDHSKNGSYKDGRYKEKYREELDRDQRHHVDKYRDKQRSSRVYTSERSDSKHYREENRLAESHYKKTKLQDSDSSRRVDVYSTKLKDNRGRKRSSDDIEEHSDVKSRTAKDFHEDIAKYDSRSGRARQEDSHIDKVDSSLNNSRPKSSPKSSAYAVKDQNRYHSRQEESTRKDLLSEESRRSVLVSRDHTTSGGRDIMPERPSDKARLKDEIRSDDRVSRLDSRTSPNQLTEKSPSSATERRSERLTSKGGRDSSFSRDNGREREYQAEKPNVDGSYQDEIGSSLSTRTAQLQGNSPSHLPPPPPVRVGVDSPSVLGSYEEDTRSQNGDHSKPNNRYNKRSGGDSSIGRGPGTPWKSTPSTWPSPVANGFMHLQHGPPGGFHPAMQQFPGPPLFGVRPSMDLNHTSYHIHETANRFPGHSRPYGWHNPVDDHMQIWDGNRNIFGEWDQNRHLINNRGWEMNAADMWSGPTNGNNVNMEFPIPQKEHHEYPGHRSRDEQPRSEQPIADAGGTKLPNDLSSKSKIEKTSEPPKLPSAKGTSETDVRFCCNYLHKLDISSNLAQPDLFKQYISMIDSGEKLVAGNVSKKGQQKNDKGVPRVMAKSKKYARNALFPTANEGVFQKALSVYKKQNEGLESAKHSAGTPVSKEQDNPPDASTDGDNVKNASSEDHMEEDLLLSNSASADLMEVEERTAVVSVEFETCENPDSEEKHHDYDEEQKGDNSVDADDEQIGDDKEEPGDNDKTNINNPGDADEEQQSDMVSDAVVFVEGSEKSSEALNPECRVNLSRIHLSPESTH